MMMMNSLDEKDFSSARGYLYTVLAAKNTTPGQAESTALSTLQGTFGSWVNMLNSAVSSL